MVVGLWESLPLRTLERRLLERNIADPATIKVNISHRKIVEISSTFVNVLEWGKDIFLKCGILSWKPPCHKWNMNNLQSAKTADCNDFRCDSVRWMWKWGMQNKQTRHRWSHLSMASYSSVPTWCLSYQSTLWPHFPSCGNNWNYWNCCMYFFNRGDQAGYKFQVFWKIATCQFWWGVIKPD